MFTRGWKPGRQWTDILTEEAITGDALMALLHSDLKEMGITSIGHRLTILKAVYDLKLKQHLPIEADDYVPLCEPDLPCNLHIAHMDTQY